MKLELIDEVAAAKRIESAARVIITTHQRADGDAIASCAVMQRVLRERGKRVRGLLHESVTPRYRRLAALEPLGVWEPSTAAELLRDADLILVLDTCSEQQLGSIAALLRQSGAAKLAIDHHITRDDIVDAAVVDENAAATALMVLRLLDRAGWPIDAASAHVLFAGLATDTGWFRFSNAGAEAFSAAARLIERGAVAHEWYERLYLDEPLVRARLAGAVLRSFELLAGGRLAVVRLDQTALRECGASSTMTEDLVNEPQRVGSVVACAVFVEPEDGGPIRVSLRSKRDVDVAEIARRFGGGGHARAAGARIAGTLKDVAERVTVVMLDALGPAS